MKASEMAQWLKDYTALPEDLSYFLVFPVGVSKSIAQLSFISRAPGFWLSRPPGHMHTDTPIHIISNHFKNKYIMKCLETKTAYIL